MAGLKRCYNPLLSRTLDEVVSVSHPLARTVVDALWDHQLDHVGDVLPLTAAELACRGLPPDAIALLESSLHQAGGSHFTLGARLPGWVSSYEEGPPDLWGTPSSEEWLAGTPPPASGRIALTGSLWSAGIRHNADLARATRSQLLGIELVEPPHIDLLHKHLARRGLRLGMTIRGWQPGALYHNFDPTDA